MDSEPLPTTERRRELTVFFAGVVTCLLTTFLIYTTAEEGNTSIISWSVWFVVPVGAILCGMAAASGAYVGARVLHQRPTMRMALSMTLLGFCTYWLSTYLAYLGLSYKGVPIADYVGFWEYYAVTITGAELVMLRGGQNMGAVGVLGYVLALLQVGGFSLGGFALWGYLVKKQYCYRCKRYFKSKTIIYGATTEQINSYIARLPFSFPDLGQRVARTIDGRKYSGLRIVLHSCPKCQRKRISFEVERYYERDVAVVYDHEGELELPKLKRR